MKTHEQNQQSIGWLGVAQKNYRMVVSLSSNCWLGISREGEDGGNEVAAIETTCNLVYVNVDLRTSIYHSLPMKAVNLRANDILRA